MHHFLERVSSSPTAGGGNCHKAAATTEIIVGANFSANTVTLNPCRSKQSDVVRSVTPTPIISIPPLDFDDFSLS